MAAAAADLVLVVHLGFVLFVALGGLLALRWPRVAWLHVPAAVWGAAIEFGGWICPLTPLENHLREQAGRRAYDADFVARYLLPVIYPEGLTREAQFVLGAAVIVLNAGIYGMVWRRTAHGRPMNTDRQPSRTSATSVTMQPIGIVRSGYTETSQIPKGRDARHDAEGVLEIRPDLEAGLGDIEGFSHLYVIWVFHRARGSELIACPPSDHRPHGVFATRSPQRPNPIALTVVELLGRDGPRLRVRGVDMLDGTPILDIKPYLSSVPEAALRRGWLDDRTDQGSGIR